MKCPKCATQNPENAQTCAACSYDLTTPQDPAPKPKRKISKTAIASGLLAGLAAGLMFFVNPTLAFLVALASVFSAAASIRQIRKSKGRLIGKTFAIVVAKILAASSDLCTADQPSTTQHSRIKTGASVRRN
jgi:uncharacterized protein (DUF983 family)